MELYTVCVCGREWFFSKSDLNGSDYINCTECGEELHESEMDDGGIM